MKSIKRFIAVITMGTMIFSHTVLADNSGSPSVANAGENTVYLNDYEAMKIFNDYIEKSSAIKSITMDLDGTVAVNINSGDESHNVGTNISGNIKGILNPENPADMTMAVDMNMRVNTDNLINTDGALEYMDIPYSMYYKDGYMYTDMMGNKIKIQIPLEEAINEINEMQTGIGFGMNSVNIQGLTSQFTENCITDLKIQSLSDGTKKMTYSMDMDKTLDFITSGLTGIDAANSLESLKNLISFGKVNASIILDSTNYPLKETISYTMTFNMDENTKMTSDIVLNSNISNINNTQVTFPDLSEYPDVNAYAEGITNNSSEYAEAIGIIGSADGPTSVYNTY